MIKAATRLYGRGFAILWLKPRSKMPIMAKWTSGPRQTLTELKKQYRPGMNMGVRLGRASKVDGGYLAVIDVDVKDSSGKSDIEIAGELKHLKIPGKGLKVWSGRGNGSHHIYIKTPKPVAPKRLARSETLVRVMMPSVSPSRREKAEFTLEELEQGWRLRPAWEISLMGEGQQVVLPPSIHPDSGQKYKWNTDGEHTIPFFEIEGGLNEKTQKEKIEDFTPTAYDLWTSGLSTEIIHQIIEGEGVEDRSSAIFGAAIAMRKCGFSDDQILTCFTDEENYLGQAAYDHAKTRSRKRAAEWVLNFTMKKAGKVADARHDFEIVDAAAVEPVDQDAAKATLQELFPTDGSDWKTKLERDHKEGKPKTSLKNLLLIFRNVNGPEPFLGYDEFSIADFWLRDMPWGEYKGLALADPHVRKIKEWLSKNYRIEPSQDKILEALLIISDDNKFHPVQEYLSDLKWDGEPRAANWLYTYLNAKGPKEYIEAVGLKTLVAMIARVYEPGCKFDHVLILEGEQGIGKSSAARILAGKWFSDAHINVQQKDAVQNIQGSWIHEMGEMAAMHKAEVNAFKDFITRQVDKIRPPYGRLPVTYPRQMVFVGTTNNKNYLKDPTGNRRFWPVSVGVLRRKELENDRDQILAEAHAIWLISGEKLYLNPIQESFARKEQNLRLEHDELDGALQQFFESKDGKPLAENGFTFFDLLEKCDVLKGSRNDRPTQMRVAATLKNLGFDNTIKWEKDDKKMVRKWRKKPMQKKAIL